ncbi:MAG: type I secretion system permease/ATPase [Beijerinckiaceae bacterium]|nr:type I secretion system permease/ATPase [Beijerinckiaceae bacterium]
MQHITADPLTACLLFVAAHHGRAVSREVVLAGLPIESGVLSAREFGRAALRAGLDAEAVQRSLADIPALVLPVVLLMDGQAIVLSRIEADGTCTVFVPGSGEASRTMTRAELEAGYAGYAFLLRPRPVDERGHDAQGRPLEKARAFGWFRSVVATFRDNYVHIALAALLINILALAFPLFTMAVYDRVLPNYAIPSLVALSIGVLLAFVFDFVIRLARSRMIDMTGKQADVVLAARIYEHLLGVRLAHRPARIGIVANQIRDFDSVREFFTSATLISVTDILFAFIFIGIMFLIAGPIAWIPLLLVPVVVAIGLLIQKPLDRAMQRFQGEAAAKHGILIETLSGLETIKAMGAQSRMQTNWERSVAASARAGEDVHHWSSLALTMSNTAQQVASLLIMIVGVFLVMNNTITIGGLVAANMLSGRVLAPLTNIAAMIARANQTMVSLRAIDAIMALPTDKPVDKVLTARKIESGAITFDQVSFTYPGGARPALEGVSFRIRAGERVGIVGKIGSGKTTIGRLMINLYAPDSGRILIDNADQRQFDPVDLRKDIGFVLQDVDLFMGTLRDNIAISRPDASDAEIIAAAKLAGVDIFAAQHPDGYDMRIAEGGRSLSGGQRQSVALARVLLRKPKILFLDEPTSALDVSSEAEFCSKIDQMLGRDTTLVVCTHRVTLLGFVDRIIVFENGRVAADGPREQVLTSLSKRQPARMPGRVA